MPGCLFLVTFSKWEIHQGVVNNYNWGGEGGSVEIFHVANSHGRPQSQGQFLLPTPIMQSCHIVLTCIFEVEYLKMFSCPPCEPSKCVCQHPYPIKFSPLWGVINPENKVRKKKKLKFCYKHVIKWEWYSSIGC